MLASVCQVGVTNTVLQGVGGLSKLRSLHMPDAFRVTDAGLSHLSTLTGAFFLLAASNMTVGLAGLTKADVLMPA